MNTRRFYAIGLAALALLAFTTALARIEGQQGQDPGSTTLVQSVRQATERFKDLDEAQAAGYGLFHGCVSGPQEGAMGIHYVQGDLVGDALLNPAQPESLIYEVRGGQTRLVGVEYIVFAEAWHESNEAPPVLLGQMFNYVGSPNRYGIPAFYELHVWAWKHNPNGIFADFNPNVSCDQFTGQEAAGH